MGDRSVTKNLTYYRRLPYARRCKLFIEDGQRYWHAWIEELPGCEVDSVTKVGAYLALTEVFEDYIKAKLEWQSVIPEPTRWPKLQTRSRAKRSKAILKVVKAPELPRPDVSNQEAKERSAESLVSV